MTDDPPDTPATDSDLRRRAAWLFVSLAVAAALVVFVLFKVVGTSSGTTDHTRPGPDDSLIAQGSTSPERPTTTRGSTTHTTARSSSSSSANPISCTSLCIVDGDPGRSIDAINDYRAQHGKSRVPGQVSAAAQQCALSNGGSCKGNWAESEVASPTGAAALEKIIPLGKLLASGLKSFDVGWAYDPKSHQYFFALVRHS